MRVFLVLAWVHRDHAFSPSHRLDWMCLVRIEIVLVEAVVLEAVHLMKWLLVVVVVAQQWKQFQHDHCREWVSQVEAFYSLVEPFFDCVLEEQSAEQLMTLYRHQHQLELDLSKQHSPYYFVFSTVLLSQLLTV